MMILTVIPDDSDRATAITGDVCHQGSFGTGQTVPDSNPPNSPAVKKRLSSPNARHTPANLPRDSPQTGNQSP